MNYKNKKILITGATGMLGKTLSDQIPEADTLGGRSDLDLSNPEIWNVMKSMDSYDYIIHTTAYTNMDMNENNPVRAHHLHCGVVKYLQLLSDKVIYVSAQGRDLGGVYFKSKLDGEKSTLSREGDLVIRTNIVGKGGLSQWALRELKLGRSINGYTNSIFNPVHVNQLSEFIKQNLELTGVVNVCSEDVISKYDFINKLADLYGYNKGLVFSKKLYETQDLTINEEDNITFKYSLPYEDVLYS